MYVYIILSNCKGLWSYWVAGYDFTMAIQMAMFIDLFNTVNIMKLNKWCIKHFIANSQITIKV